MAEQLSPDEFEQANLHEEKIRGIEKLVLKHLTNQTELSLSSKTIKLLICEETIHIDSTVWEYLLTLCKHDFLIFISKNPNPSIPSKVFESVFKKQFCDGKMWENQHRTDIIKAFLNSTNPNFPPQLLRDLILKIKTSLKGQYQKYMEPKELSIVLKTVFESKNPFLRWKNNEGQNLILQFLDNETYIQLTGKLTHSQIENLLLVLAKNSPIHTPDLVARLIGLTKKNYKLQNLLDRTEKEDLELEHSNNPNGLPYKIRKAVVKNFEHFGNNSYEILPYKYAKKTITTSWVTYRTIVEDHIYSEFFNLAETFQNLLEALKIYQTQTEQYRLSNISALRTKLQVNSFENLIDISNKTSVTRLVIDIANYIEKLNVFQKNVTYRALIQEFEDFVKNFRFDLIENSGTDGRAYQLCYNQTETFSYEYKTGSPIEYKYFGNRNKPQTLQGHIQQGQNPKELVDGLVEIQNILKQLKPKITKIPIVELTPEQIQDKQFLDEGYAEIESLFQLFPDLTAQELFVKLCPGEPVPDKVEEFEWLLGYIEKERLSQMDKNIGDVAEANLAELKALSKVLNPIFAPDQSVEFKLNEGQCSDQIKVLWKKVQTIQAVYNGLKADKNGIDKSDKRYSIFYKKFSEILLEEMVKFYQEIAYVSPNQNLSKVANAKIKAIGEYLSSSL
jgi:hypothetical protein